MTNQNILKAAILAAMGIFYPVIAIGGMVFITMITVGGAIYNNVVRRIRGTNVIEMGAGRFAPVAIAMVGGTVVVGSLLLTPASIMAHERSHLRHRDPEKAATWQIITGWLLTAAALLIQNWMTALLVILLGILVASLALNARSRRCEYRADKEAAQETNPQDLIEDLENILDIDESRGIVELFREHPHPEDRLRAIRALDKL